MLFVCLIVPSLIIVLPEIMTTNINYYAVSRKNVISHVVLAVESEFEVHFALSHQDFKLIL